MDHTLHYVTWLSTLIGAVGILIVTVGVLKMFYAFVALEFTHPKEEKLKEREKERQVLGSYLLLGLEFLVAADIVQTIIEPSPKDLGILAGVVFIRTVLSYFLTREMKESDYGQAMQSQGRAS